MATASTVFVLSISAYFNYIYTLCRNSRHQIDGFFFMLIILCLKWWIGKWFWQYFWLTSAGVRISWREMLQSLVSHKVIRRQNCLSCSPCTAVNFGKSISLPLWLKWNQSGLDFLASNIPLDMGYNLACVSCLTHFENWSEICASVPSLHNYINYPPMK